METHTALTTRPADPRVIADQIGRMNVLAISGGRLEATTAIDIDGEFINGLRLPIRYGYAVEILLAANDTYIVRRTFTRAGKTTVKAERTEVYADELGDAAYTISCWN